MLKNNEKLIRKLLSDDFIMGMDISSLPEIEEKGGRYFDFDGDECDVLDFIKKNGVNYIRLRIWNDPQNVPESGGYCDLNHTIKFAKRIKERGFKFFLDFHYSDWWADPGKQNKPKAWENLDFDGLVKAVYGYTKDVLEALDDAHAYPDMVQIGNEIRSGMLFPDGLVQNWGNLAQLINAGIAAVRATQKGRDSAVVIHLDQGGKYKYFEEFFDNAISYGVTDFDIIGLSYYPFWHGTYNEFKITMDKLVDRYGKPLVVAETAYAHRLHEGNSGIFTKDQEEIGGFAATEVNQRIVLELIMNITANVKNNMGLGVFYWEPLMIPVNCQDENKGWFNLAIFDSNGKPLEAVKAFGFCPANADNNAVIKIYNPAHISVKIGESPKLPKAVKVLLSEGSIQQRNVYWDNINASILQNEGEYTIKGMVEKTDKKASIKLLVRSTPIESINYVSNPIFDEGLKNWQLKTESEALKTGIGIENRSSMPSFNYFYYKGSANFTLDLSQTIYELENGEYSLSVLIRGDNTTGVEASLYADLGNSNKLIKKMYPSDDHWHRYSIKGIRITGGQINIGVEIVSPPVKGKISCFELIKTG